MAYDTAKTIALAACLTALALAASALAGPTPAEAHGHPGLVALKRQGYPMAFQNGPRLVTLRQKPQRILVFGLGPAELLIELGLADLLVGRSDLGVKLVPHPKYAQAMASIPAWDPDRLAEREAAWDGPDFAYGRLSPDSPELGMEYLTVYSSIAGDKREYYREVTALGTIFHVKDRAAAHVSELEERLASLALRIADREPVRVMVVKSLEGDRLVAAGGDDFASEVLRLSGALNVFEDLGGSPKLESQEAIKRRPGFIVVVNDGRGSPYEMLARVREDPVLSTLQAVADHRIITMDETWLTPGPRLAEAAEILAKALHPRAMQ